MLFHTTEYFFLLFGSTCLYFLLPHRFRWIVLLSASYWFYSAWQIEFLGLLLFSTFIDYYCGLSLGKSYENNKRKLWLFLSISTNLSILGYFKYRLLFTESLGTLAPATEMVNWLSTDFLLPIGISFYTLQSMGYTIDVYRRSRIPERHPGYFALYVAYFPQLIAGPIERSTKLLPQLRTPQNFSPDEIREGAQLFLLGLFKKLVLVAYYSPIIASVYSDPSHASGITTLIVVYLSGLYIYLDFSAYTDMARGSAKIMGIKLSKNFNHPLGAQSIRDYWQRWHMSLTQWIFDYLYQPISKFSHLYIWQLCVIIFTFAVVGLWHGAAWNFILFGIYHGILVLCELIFERLNCHWPRSRIWNACRIIRTQLLLASSCIFFLSPDLSTVVIIFENIINGLTSKFDLGSISNFYSLMMGLLGSLVITVVHSKELYEKLVFRFLNWPSISRWCIYYMAFFLLILMSGYNINAFVYFQF